MGHGLARATDMVAVVRTEAEVPWHELGVHVPTLVTVQDIPTLCPRFADPVLKVPCELDGKPVADHYFTVRSDDRTVLGHVGTEYVPFQNMDMAQTMAEILQDPHGPCIDTLGLLWDGRKSWVLAKFPESMVLRGRNGREDVIGQYLLFSNAFDGSQRMRAQATTIRVVCNNTLTMAHAQSKKNTSTWMCHSGDVLQKARNIGDILAITFKGFEETQALYQALIHVEPTHEQVETVLKALFPDTKTNRAQLQRERVATLAENGTGNAPFAGTAWALYNGVTELVDYKNNEGSTREDARDMRLNSVWFGSGASFKATALKTIAETCLN